MIGHPFGPGGRERPLRLKSIFPQNANSIITEDKTARAEHVGLDMQRTPSMVEIVGEGKVEFVCAGGVRETSAELLEEVHFAVETNSGYEWYHQTSDQELIETGVLRSMPNIQSVVERVVLEQNILDGGNCDENEMKHTVRRRGPPQR